jgi:hypothetical protein
MDQIKLFGDSTNKESKGNNDGNDEDSLPKVPDVPLSPMKKTDQVLSLLDQ